MYLACKAFCSWTRSMELGRQWKSPASRTTMLLLSVALLVTALVAPSTAHSRTPEEWQLLYNQLKHKITQHENTYPTGDLKHHPAYVQALEIFAKDRDDALMTAQEAQASSSPEARVFFHKFMDLVDSAQSAGNGALELADIIFRVEDNWGPRSWGTLCVIADHEGKPIYQKAGELEFDQNVTREQVRVMLNTALKDLDTGWSLRCGSGYVGQLYPTPSRDPMPQADRGLRWVEEVRKLANYFSLPDVHSSGTELMNRYLRDALCLLDNGHQWYLDLAKQYNLSDAKKHIKGFYATVYGKVELKTKSGRRPADGASVIICDPHDGTTWETTADENGDYEIEKAILHKDCSPFDISAEWCGERTDEQYTGPLTKPDPSKRHEVNLLLDPSITGDFEFHYVCQLVSSYGVTVSSKYEHAVPFSVNFDQDPPIVEGEGEYSDNLVAKKGVLRGSSPVTMSETPGGPRVFDFGGKIRLAVPGLNASAVGTYTSGGFRETNKWTNKKELFGELIKSESGDHKLKWGFIEKFSRGGPESKHGPWTFPLEDGYQREFPMEMSVAGANVKSTFTVTLHLDEN